jgi:hypothetical protein
MLTGKCLKVEHFCRIDYDFLKSHVPGPRDQKDSVSEKKDFLKILACVHLNKFDLFLNSCAIFIHASFHEFHIPDAQQAHKVVVSNHYLSKFFLPFRHIGM